MRTSSDEGLRSTEYGSRNMLLILAAIVLAVGIGICATILPDALNNQHYPLIMFLASLPCIGIVSLWLALKNRKTHTQFGQTRLFLDPEIPGIGGQLGGQFTLTPKGHDHQFQSLPKLRATLCCINVSGSNDVDRNGSGATVNTLWQNTAPVFLKTSADGIEASFVFELPDTCTSSNTSGINWQVLVEGEFDLIGEFCRTWDIHIEDQSSQSTSINIPLNFSKEFEANERKNAQAESGLAVPLETNGNHIEFCSQWLSKGAGITGAVMGAVFSAIGIYSFLDGWGAGVVFILGGLGIAGASIYAANKTVRIKIDKNSRKLFVHHELFRQNSLIYEGSIISPEQFEIVEMGGADANTNGNQVGIYTVNFVSQNETIKLSSMIEGERAAQALRDRIVSQIFEERAQRIAA